MARLTWRLSDEQLIRRLRFQQRWWRPFWTTMLIVGLLLLAATFWIVPPGLEPDPEPPDVTAAADRIVNATPASRLDFVDAIYRGAGELGFDAGGALSTGFSGGLLTIAYGIFFATGLVRRLRLIARGLERKLEARAEELETISAPSDASREPEESSVRRLCRRLRHALGWKLVREVTDEELYRRLGTRCWVVRLTALAVLAIGLFVTGFGAFVAWESGYLYAFQERIYDETVTPPPSASGPDALWDRWFEVLSMRVPAGFLEGVQAGFVLHICLFVGLMLTIWGATFPFIAARRAELLRRCGILPAEE